MGENSAVASAFDANAFLGALVTASVGRNLVYRERIDTTMELARTEAQAGALDGTLVLAEEQTAGRGRRGRSFHSPAGENLYFTLILRVAPEVHRRLPVAVPLAVCRALRAEGVDARIKWPNDIWVGERKLSGMLIDAETAADGLIAYPGIGINVNGDPTRDPALADIATSLRRETGRPHNREALLARICNGLEQALGQPREEMLGSYRELSVVLGRRVTVHPASGAPYDAEAVGLAEDGSLVVRRDGGREEIVTAGDVSVRPS
jgi:BirA family biotin operon repressor/biotin-[acetyl-CoA-carboxylase] ligase